MPRPLVNPLASKCIESIVANSLFGRNYSFFFFIFVKTKYNTNRKIFFSSRFFRNYSSKKIHFKGLKLNEWRLFFFFQKRFLWERISGEEIVKIPSASPRLFFQRRRQPEIIRSALNLGFGGIPKSRWKLFLPHSAERLADVQKSLSLSLLDEGTMHLWGGVMAQFLNRSSLRSCGNFKFNFPRRNFQD